MSATAAAADPLRAYVVTLRTSRRLSQQAAAEGAGIQPRTYISWENGETKKIDIDALRSIVEYLGGAFEHLKTIHLKTPEEGRALALQWLSLSEDEKLAAVAATEKLNRIVVLAENDPARLDEVLRLIRDRVRDDPELLSLISGFLAGLAARGR